MYVRKCIVTFSMKNLKHRQESYFWNDRMDSEIANLASIECLV